MSTTYTQRRLERTTVAAHSGDTGITMTTGWGFGMPSAAYRDQLPVGTDVEVEHRNSGVVGIRKVGDAWLYRRSDQWLEAEIAEWSARHARERRELLDANYADWTRREGALPMWVGARLATFRERGGENFELDGWGYELVIAELAVAYRDAIEAGADLSGTDWWKVAIPVVEEIADREGTSGNQHNVARMLAVASSRGADVSGTPSGLTPITGDPFYEGRG